MYPYFVYGNLSFRRYNADTVKDLGDLLKSTALHLCCDRLACVSWLDERLTEWTHFWESEVYVHKLNCADDDKDDVVLPAN